MALMDNKANQGAAHGTAPGRLAVKGEQHPQGTEGRSDPGSPGLPAQSGPEGHQLAVCPGPCPAPGDWGARAQGTPQGGGRRATSCPASKRQQEDTPGPLVPGHRSRMGRSRSTGPVLGLMAGAQLARAAVLAPVKAGGGFIAVDRPSWDSAPVGVSESGAQRQKPPTRRRDLSRHHLPLHLRPHRQERGDLSPPRSRTGPAWSQRFSCKGVPRVMRSATSALRRTSRRRRMKCRSAPPSF